MADITLLATADWDHPLWTNKQHVACALADLGHRVLYVESIGLRPMRAARPGGTADIIRVWRRLRYLLKPPRQVRPNLWVWSPLVLPGARRGLVLWMNRCSLKLGLALAQRFLAFRRDCFWTYNPMTLAVLALTDYRRIVYHCVDAIQAQPDMPAEQIRFWEERLCCQADAVFVTSPKLLRDLAPYNPQTRFYPNVADARHFARAMEATLSLPPELEEIPRPRLGFVGAISGYKLDLPLLDALARRHPHWALVLVGPIGEGDPLTDVSALSDLPNVHLLGQKSYATLPAYLKGFDVALLPLQFNAYTQAMFPMKFFEYLAAGLPVVASAIDALRPFADLALLVNPDPEAFSTAITAALAGNGPDRAHRLSGANRHTYRARTEAMLADLTNLE